MSLHTTLLNGSATIINGRGINHRKLDQDERAELATDAVTGARPFVPSCDQACIVFGRYTSGADVPMLLFGQCGSRSTAWRGPRR